MTDPLRKKMDLAVLAFVVIFFLDIYVQSTFRAQLFLPLLSKSALLVIELILVYLSFHAGHIKMFIIWTINALVAIIIIVGFFSGASLTAPLTALSGLFMLVVLAVTLFYKYL